MTSGWECPRCGRGNSPYMLQCNCLGKPGEPSGGYSDNKFTLNSDRSPEVVRSGTITDPLYYEGKR